MKKILKIAAALVMAASLTACSDSSKDRYNSAADAYQSYYDNATSIIDINKYDNGNNSKNTSNSGTENSTVDCTINFNNSDYSGTYLGEVKSGIPDGSGVFSGKNNVDTKIKATGMWKNGQLNGEGNVVLESGDTSDDIKKFTFEGQFVNTDPTGEIKWTIEYSAEYAAAEGFDRVVYTGKWVDGDMQRPVKAKVYSGSTLLQENVIE